MVQYGRTPLYYAVGSGVCGLLIDNGADLNIIDKVSQCYS